VVAGAEHLVEVHPAVEEAPSHVAHQRPQERVGGDGVRAGLAFGGPLHFREILVAAEFEGAEAKALVAGGGIGGGRDDFVRGEGGRMRGGVKHGHGGSPDG